ncbi:hypothetical protein E1B28_008740 [Marasmius oreades]|uniref:Uncharacterized protein n=1 Tax=Marasmius oreades TaxID=181124 RepID=A0A9P7S0L2_9AGAR|nr:uncharacterized protein E1B28_008740 [Marasmius oreades]KAG7092383.1 hypothetical protein E1B28_008740 [Marasmius oreades]
MSFPAGSASSNSSRCTSEDWVQQASGLTIAAPLKIGGSVMATDTRNELIATPSSVSSKPQLTPLNTSFDSSLRGYPNHNAPMDGIQHDSTSVEHSASSESLPRAFPHIPPSISVQPPTPDMPAAHLIFTRSSTPLSDSSMSISTSPVSFTSSPLRRKFTMGPRADCEKCRLGVKGHSVHLD